MKPLSGHSSDVQDFGQVVTKHIAATPDHLRHDRPRGRQRPL
jgi:hypothetical protein